MQLILGTGGHTIREKLNTIRTIHEKLNTIRTIRKKIEHHLFPKELIYKRLLAIVPTLLIL